MQVKTYEEMRDFIQCGDLFEFGGNSLIGKVIRFFTKQQVNHSALGMSINEYSNHAGNRKFVLEADSYGIVLNTSSKDVQDCLKSGGQCFGIPFYLSMILSVFLWQTGHFKWLALNTIMAASLKMRLVRSMQVSVNCFVASLFLSRL